MSDFGSPFEKTIGRLRSDFTGIRTGRATTALVEDLEIDYYGARTPLKALAALSTPDPRTLVIQPWDKNALSAIEKAIHASSLGLQPIADRDVIRLSIPSLTEERRKELAKLISRHSEDARIGVRRIREDALREIGREAKNEDEKFRRRNELQKIVDEVNQKIEDMAAAKEKEVMSV